jgi:hypothetical protein
VPAASAGIGMAKSFLPKRKIKKYNVGFVIDGVVRFCYYNSKGEEINHFFIDENNFVSDQQKIVSRFLIPSSYLVVI